MGGTVLPSRTQRVLKASRDGMGEYRTGTGGCNRADICPITFHHSPALRMVVMTSALFVDSSPLWGSQQLQIPGNHGQHVSGWMQSCGHEHYTCHHTPTPEELRHDPPGNV